MRGTINWRHQEAYPGGGMALLDKQWADRPLQIIKNPHKLSEVELY
jgi:hypothetical protein